MQYPSPLSFVYMIPNVSEELSLIELAKRVKSSARKIALANSTQKDDGLWTLSQYLRDNIDPILSANHEDVERATKTDMSASAIDRLALNDSRVLSMADQVCLVAQLADPVGEVTEGSVLPNGLIVRKERVPLGVVGIIYENRPNVTSDSAALCIKSGNAAFLRGSSGAILTNIALAKLISSALSKVGLPADAVTLVRDTSRSSAIEFMGLEGYIDCLIPRGGRALIDAVRENARVPYVIDGDGNCHIFVDETADLEMAVSIIVNAKIQRPGVCNAVETLLVHEKIASDLLALLSVPLEGVEIRGDARVCEVLPQAKVVTEQDYATEFLDLILAIRVVANLSDAILHIEKYGTGHSEAILTANYNNARQFTREIDAAAVLVNASTRFVDGNQLGLGAEIGISTQKLHARGPMGLRALTSERFVIEGQGQVRL